MYTSRAMVSQSNDGYYRRSAGHSRVVAHAAGSALRDFSSFYARFWSFALEAQACMPLSLQVPSTQPLHEVMLAPYLAHARPAGS